MITNPYGDVGQFHTKFGLRAFETGPEPVDPDLMLFRLKFLKEELAEFASGMQDNDHSQMFDALLDLVYVAVGTAHLLGYPWHEGWDLVQKANMKKKRAESAEESKRNSSFDVVKPEGWTPPDISGLLEKYGY